MKQQDMIRVGCSLFTKIFLIKESQLLKQGINEHINAVMNQCFARRPLQAKESGLIGYFINPILKDRQSEFPFKPTKALEVKLSKYQEAEKTRMLEKALNQYVLLQLCSKTGSPYAEIATEILNDLARWEGGNSDQL